MPQPLVSAGLCRSRHRQAARRRGPWRPGRGDRADDRHRRPDHLRPREEGEVDPRRPRHHPDGSSQMTAYRPTRFRWTGEVMEPTASLGRPEPVQRRRGLPARGPGGAVDQQPPGLFRGDQRGWSNLPEHEAQRFPTADHLRKWLLIKAGYFTERQIVVATAAEAVRVASFIKPMDDYAVVVPKGATVSVFTAKSQSMKAQSAARTSRSRRPGCSICSPR